MILVCFAVFSIGSCVSRVYGCTGVWGVTSVCFASVFGTCLFGEGVRWSVCLFKDLWFI